jgi:hypothetical protein
MSAKWALHLKLPLPSKTPYLEVGGSLARYIWLSSGNWGIVEIRKRGWENRAKEYGENGYLMFSSKIPCSIIPLFQARVPHSFLPDSLTFLADGGNGADGDAAAAIRALCRIDIILCIALADGLDRAFRLARAAGNAIVIDNVGHETPP